MSRVVVVHGINNTYSAPELMADAWVPALLGGVALAGGAGVMSPDDVGCVFYGNVFRRPGRLLGDDDTIGLGPEDIEDPDEAALVEQWWHAASEIDPGVIPPGRRTLGMVDGVQAALAALSGSRYVAEAGELLLVLWLKQVRTYFRKPEIRSAIQEKFAAVVSADTRVVVAHSLGSVVAYEALCAHPEWPVRTLVTLGSPLGIRNVILDRLLPAPSRVGKALRGAWPGSVETWTNISDRADFVALVKKLSPVFGDRIVDIGIDNGARMHDVSRYLTAVDTGRAVVAGLREGQRHG